MSFPRQIRGPALKTQSWKVEGSCGISSQRSAQATHRHRSMRALHGRALELDATILGTTLFVTAQLLVQLQSTLITRLQLHVDSTVRNQKYISIEKITRHLLGNVQLDLYESCEVFENLCWARISLGDARSSQ